MTKRRTPEPSKAVQEPLLTYPELMVRWGCCRVTIWRRTKGKRKIRLSPGRRGMAAWELRDIEDIERNMPGIVPGVVR